MAVPEAAWCDEALLGGLLEDLLPEGDPLTQTGLGSQQRQRGSRKRRHTILTDSEDGEGDAVGADRDPHRGQHSRGAQHTTPRAARAGVALAGKDPNLSPVAEEQEGEGSELQDSMGGESEGMGLSTSSGVTSHGSAAGPEELLLAVDPVLAALEEQGAILHVHRHEKVCLCCGGLLCSAGCRTEC
jgi:hypothetical protein